MRRLLLFLCVAGLMAAPPQHRRHRLKVPVWVEEESAAIDAGQVTATLAGGEARVSRVLGPRDGLMLLVVSDMVGDMTLADIAKRALNESIRQMPSNVWVGLFRAQDGLRVQIDPTPDKEQVATAIESLPVSGRAGLLESVQPAASVGDAVLFKAAVRTAVLFVTDSDIRNYREDFTNPVINESDHRDMSRRFPDALIRERISKVETALNSLQTPVFIVHLVYRGEGLNEAYQAGLMRLATATGGATTFCRSQSEIPDAIARTLETIITHHSVEVLLPENTPRELGLTLESEGRTLSYRSRFSN